MAEIKITFLGDIMCEPLLLKASRRMDGSYNFDGVFSNVRQLLSASDFVVGNLETPLAGEAAGYVKELFSFNAPDSFAEAIKNAGIGLVSTANNHCLDRGLEGFVRTIEVLDEKGLAHTGTFRTAEERKEAAYFTVQGKTFAVIAPTYGTNYYETRVLLTEQQRGMLNNVWPQNVSRYIINTQKKAPLFRRIWGKFLSVFKMETQCAIKKTLHMTYNRPFVDDALDEEVVAPYMEQLRADIKKAKENADYVLFYPHTGGQFNAEPGRITEHLVDHAIKFGCDAVIASHPHVVQKARWRGDIPVFYSLGNFSMSPNSVYLLHDRLPEYGLAAHLYVDESGIVKTTFSILKILEEKKEQLTVFPVDELWHKLDWKGKAELEREVKQIYQFVAGVNPEYSGIQREYTLLRKKEGL